jgi:hypothetical protein
MVPDGARTESGDLHLAQRLGVQFPEGEMAFEGDAVPGEQADVAGAVDVAAMCLNLTLDRLRSPDPHGE